jgi:hypothetical protein
MHFALVLYRKESSVTFTSCQRLETEAFRVTASTERDFTQGVCPRQLFRFSWELQACFFGLWFPMFAAPRCRKENSKASQRETKAAKARTFHFLFSCPEAFRPGECREISEELKCPERYTLKSKVRSTVKTIQEKAHRTLGLVFTIGSKQS